jgi:putative membrane protein
MTGFGMGFSSLWMVLIWVLIIGGGIWLVATLFPKASTTNNDQPGDTALTILQQRYARGELTKEEFEAIRHDLKQ